MRRRYPWQEKARLPAQLNILHATPLGKRVARAIAKTPQYLEIRRELAPYVRERIISKELADAVLTEFLDEVVHRMPDDAAAVEKIVGIMEMPRLEAFCTLVLRDAIRMIDRRTGTKVTVITDLGKMRIVIEQGGKK